MLIEGGLEQGCFFFYSPPQRGRLGSLFGSLSSRSSSDGESRVKALLR